MSINKVINFYKNTEFINSLNIINLKNSDKKFVLNKLSGSSLPILLSSLYLKNNFSSLVILNNKEDAAFFFNDLENIFEKFDLKDKPEILFFPSSLKRDFGFNETNQVSIQQRSEVIEKVGINKNNILLISYPDAIIEKIISTETLNNNIFQLKQGEKVSTSFITEFLVEYDFEKVDFVYEPGQFSIRGGIVDVFSFSNDYPYRIEFFGDEVSSLRTFNPTDQYSIKTLDEITILPDVNSIQNKEKDSIINVFKNKVIISNCIENVFEKSNEYIEKHNEFLLKNKDENSFLEYSDTKELIDSFYDNCIVEFGQYNYYKSSAKIDFNFTPQPLFNKSFDLLSDFLYDLIKKQFKIYLFADNEKQFNRLNEVVKSHLKIEEDIFSFVDISIHEGFIDNTNNIACITDHQIFNRYHHFKLKQGFKKDDTFTFKEIQNLQSGDYVVHIDHGIGRFAGLGIVEKNGNLQEVIKIVYKDNDVLFVNIHSLHRISKYSSKDGVVPKVNKLGSSTWSNLKKKTKSRVKDIAKNLINLYAKRKLQSGFKFSLDTYMQNELEASFFFEDTPDQTKATNDIKNDMETDSPMDRLVCGDVGFGKTEVAIRAAFKAVADSKQVAILVPTTILALQHYRTFKERLEQFPCNVDYVNRFRKNKDIKDSLDKLEKGNIDIIIGTHRLVSKDVKFKDLGLLIVDEEQKFGVATKEKLREFKVNVDTLTLTATPIPRTLQLSLMGAKDISILRTPPPNRYPIQTELHVFNEQIIKEAIDHEISRGGQVYFVNNRVQNIEEIANLIKRLCPDVKIAVGHGQMNGEQLESIMVDFIDEKYDVLIATKIIESGLDIPNVNTIIINNAHHFGLSELHQLRGRVGRSNKKAFCYLLTTPISSLTDIAKKRLKAIEEFTEIGSGINIAMRDLDIRGAGDMLGGEQSGFINEMGFETFHKILDEAIVELKESDYKDLFSNENEKEINYVKDCVIETDLNIYIPKEYIENTTERLFIYKELDNINNEEELVLFEKKLKDRFGEIPIQVYKLFDTLRLRWIAMKIGFEKMVLKKDQLICYFITDKNSDYFKSPNFIKIMSFIHINAYNCTIKERNEKLLLSIQDISEIKQSLDILTQINDYITFS